ncbi:MAG: GNAT superfamily N-acetyltransferase [Acidimicrobiales bacterium]
MTGITTGFETKPLSECMGLTREIDRKCFPTEMWLNNTELCMLMEMKAEATILRQNGIEIGQAITLPEHDASIILDGVDKDFNVNKKGVYSYSEAIIPECQNQGFGALMLAEIAIRMRQRGFMSISAHVRTRYGWNIRRGKELQTYNTRFIYDFWDDPQEVVQYQAARL